LERLRPLAVVLALCALPGCKDDPPDVATPAASTVAKRKPKTPDRLAPGELEQGDAEAFGFRAPQKMRQSAHFGDAAHFVGRVPPEAVANYVRERVAVAHVEIGASRTVFPRARIKGGDAARVFRFEVVPIRGGTRLVVRDVTPKPAVQGLTDEERWRRAGFGPDRKPLQEVD
jgi:hypothetical protein